MRRWPAPTRPPCAARRAPRWRSSRWHRAHSDTRSAACAEPRAESRSTPRRSGRSRARAYRAWSLLDLTHGIAADIGAIARDAAPTELFQWNDDPRREKTHTRSEQIRSADADVVVSERAVYIYRRGETEELRLFGARRQAQAQLLGGEIHLALAAYAHAAGIHEK